MRKSETFLEFIRRRVEEAYFADFREGHLEGRHEEARKLACIIVTSKFGQIDRVMKTKLNRLSLTQAEELAVVLSQLQCLADLTRWLKKHASNGN